MRRLVPLALVLALGLVVGLVIGQRTKAAPSRDTHTIRVNQPAASLSEGRRLVTLAARTSEEAPPDDPADIWIIDVGEKRYIAQVVR